MVKAYNTIFDIRDYGASADGKTLCSSTIQAAIDACRDCGGGTVLVSQGKYLTGTIQLYSGITLQLDRGATLLGSPDFRHYRDLGTPDNTSIYCTPIIADYPTQAIIFAKDAENFAIIGGGKIDGQGQWGRYFPNPEDINQVRPSGIILENCEKVAIRDISINNTAFWSTRFVMCKEMTISGVRIHSLQSGNGDGLDFVGGENITVSDCIIKAGDDCIS
ncbi:MAG: glycosyl hydrolase family 28 protein, partial [Clostridiales bacterium]|nr:glycosyl hydrolase family 28 protein [Clostridiales bacterium]